MLPPPAVILKPLRRQRRSPEILGIIRGTRFCRVGCVEMEQWWRPVRLCCNYRDNNKGPQPSYKHGLEDNPTLTLLLAIAYYYPAASPLKSPLAPILMISNPESINLSLEAFRD